MAETTERTDVRRALFLERLIKAWDKAPSLRLGELIVVALSMEGALDIRLLQDMTDTDLVEKIERHVLLGEGPKV
jgi:hypothetical protein